MMAKRKLVRRMPEKNIPITDNATHTRQSLFGGVFAHRNALPITGLVSFFGPNKFLWIFDH